MCNALDEDGSGSISMDEFLNYFGQDVGEDDEFHKSQEESLLQEEIYPAWVFEQEKLAQAQTLLLAMYNELERQN